MKTQSVLSQVVCAAAAVCFAAAALASQTAFGQVLDYGRPRDYRLAAGAAQIYSGADPYHFPGIAQGPVYEASVVALPPVTDAPAAAIVPAPAESYLAAAEAAYQPVADSNLVNFEDPLPPPPNDVAPNDALLHGAGTANQSNSQLGGQQQQQAIGPPPEDTRLLFLRSATPLLRPGQWEFDWGVWYSLQDSLAPVVVPPGLLDNRRFRDHLIYSPFALRTGVTDRAQAFVNLPVGWGHTTVDDVSFRDQDTIFDVGDVSFGVNYLLRRGQGVCSDLVLNLDCNVPTGSLPYRDDPFAAYNSDGFFSLGASLLAIREFDPIVIFYGAGYRYRFERDYLGGVLNPGQEVNYNLGIGFGVNERITLSTALLGAFQTDYEFDREPIFGSSQEPISLRCAATVVADECRIIEPFVYIGLTDDAPDAQLGFIVTRRF